ncbi:MAG: putative ABC transporter permease [Lacrimispora sp.]|uniref:putative ABC transporter permease n=1 Tax=Lacrimispora sp. TaxID=2719234 RepID=UPI0039E361D3
MYVYTWYQWLMFFYSYCFFGWIFESAYVSIKSGAFINRGFLRLPLLPLYGSGAILMLFLTLPVQDNLFLVFLLGMIGATVLEYVTGYVMERLFKMKYWDYSDKPLNLNGYICLTSSLAWGFLTIMLTEFIHKPVEWLIFQISPALCTALSLALFALFLADAIHSTREALDLGRVLESMTKLKAELEEAQVQIALLKAETTDKVAEIRTEVRLKAASLKAETADALKESVLAEHLQSLTEAREKLTTRLTISTKGLLRRNPSASSRLFGEALKELKEHSRKYRKSE